jgi:hypothetical protein
MAVFVFGCTGDPQRVDLVIRGEETMEVKIA